MTTAQFASNMLKVCSSFILILGVIVSVFFFSKGTTIYQQKVTSTGITYTDKVTSYNNVYTGFIVFLGSFTVFSFFLTVASIADNLDK